MSGTPEKQNADPYWWTPWAVLVGLLLFGLLGFLGVLSPNHSGPTAADVPVTIATTPTPTPKPSATAQIIREP
jgi:hypothetical protein